MNIVHDFSPVPGVVGAIALFGVALVLPSGSCLDRPDTTEFSQPTCSPACANGGGCTESNMCSCTHDWTGPTCAVLDGFALIQPGTFMMGSPSTELGRDLDEEQHQVTLTRAFWMQTTEVTHGQWTALSGGVNPSHFPSCGDDCPVEGLDWHSAVAFANARSASEGLSACYTLTGCFDPANGWQDGEHSGCTGATFVGVACTGYRLPTEAEWEYAARAGTTTATYTGNLSEGVNDCTTLQPALDLIAWWCRNSDQKQRVAQRTANAWGLYDMLGNVWEWVHDWYAPYPAAAEEHPLGPSTGSSRVARGGGFNMNAQFQRMANRFAVVPSDRYWNLGFRLCRTASP